MKILSQSHSAIELEAPGKINLTLEILGKRTDGYHEVRFVMTTIALADLVCVEIKKKEKGEGDITIKANRKDLPVGPTNTCYKAAAAILQLCPPEKRNTYAVLINITKRIPLAGGLGGSSTDAAAVLIGLNELLDLKMSREELAAIAGSAGSDTSFFVFGGASLAEGRGERITSITIQPLNLPLALVISPQQWETKDAYQKFSLAAKKDNDSNKSEKMLRAIKEARFGEIGKYLVNDLELSENTDIMYISKVKSDLMDAGAAGVLMSGSGPTVYGIFSDNQALERAKQALNNKYEILALKAI